MRNEQQKSPNIVGKSQSVSVLRINSSGNEDSERRENSVVTEATENVTEIVFNLSVTEVIAASLDTAGPFSPVKLLDKVLY